MSEEEWRPLPGYVSRYAVSDLGRVYSHTRREYLRPHYHKVKGKREGYWTVTLWGDGGTRRNRYVHVLVLLAFVGLRPADKDGAAHKNGDRDDNRLTNLRWATKKENHADRYQYGSAYGIGKVTPEIVLAITRAIRSGERALDVAARFGLSQTHVNNLASGRSWPHVQRV